MYIVTDIDPELGQGCADELGRWNFERRTDWPVAMLPTREAQEEAEAAGRFPVVLADRNDNSIGGSSGDRTGLLQAFVLAGLEDACVLYIVDPEAIGQCLAAGVGTQLSLEVGGKLTPFQGCPVRMDCKVIALSGWAGPV